jgi:hypothetical protein
MPKRETVKPGVCVRRSLSSRRFWCAVLACALPVSGFADRSFSIPLDQLQTLVGRPVIKMQMTITGHSRVHTLANDCEMHFGVRISGYTGTPPGGVIEPMNLCLQKDKSKWISFADSILGVTVTAEGVPRLWPEHLHGGGPSNPDHALELHPLTRLKVASALFDFTKFVYAPDGFEGLSEASAERILSGSVKVSSNGESVTIRQKGRVGNFAKVDVDIYPRSITRVAEGHVMTGMVNLPNSARRVTLLTIAGTTIDRTMQGLEHSDRIDTLELLVLFSLSPRALYDAAKRSSSANGREVSVTDPFQLIVYGEPDSEESAEEE